MATKGFGGRTKRTTLVNTTASIAAANVRFGVTYTNTGASGTVTITLPANPAKGSTVGFAVTPDTKTLRAMPDAADTIRYSGLAAGAPLGTNSSGACWLLVANGSNSWIVASSGGI